MKKPSHIAVIGGGNLGRAIVEGLVASKYIAPANLIVTRRNLTKLRDLQELGISVTSDNRKACEKADLIILAVKPYQVGEVMKEIKPVLLPDQQIVSSVVTGVTLDDMSEVLGNDNVLFRVMPNTAIAIRESMTCISSKNASPDEQQMVVELFEQLGKAVFLNDDLMSAATVLGACGIAYAMRFIRAASQGGIEIGFSAEVSQLIAAQTAKGAASLLMANGNHPEQEIDKVTTPKGCTIAGLNEMEHQGFSSSLIKGIRTSFDAIDDIAKTVK